VKKQQRLFLILPGGSSKRRRGGDTFLLSIFFNYATCAYTQKNISTVYHSDTRENYLIVALNNKTVG
jgi:hypothetical protein